MSKQLAVTGLDQYKVTLSPDATKERFLLLEEASLILSVTSTEEQGEAVAAAAALKKWNSDLEKARKEMKAPLLAAGELLDATAEQVRTETKAEVERLEKLLVGFQEAQEAARRAAIEEQQRLERAEAQRVEALLQKEREEAAEREKARLAAEQQAINARSKKAREAAAAEAARLAREQEAAELTKEFEEVVPAITFLPPPTVEKPTGAAVQEVVEFEVFDIQALYKAFPQCVKLEVSTRNLNYLLNTPGFDISKVPGVRAWKEKKVVVRGRASKPVIETLPY